MTFEYCVFRDKSMMADHILIYIFVCVCVCVCVFVCCLFFTFRIIEIKSLPSMMSKPKVATNVKKGTAD